MSSIYQSSNLQKASMIINELDPSKFPLLLNRITQYLQAKSRQESPFSVEEQEKLQISLGLSKLDLDVLLDSIKVIFEQAAYHMTKPVALQQQLTDNLKLNENKAEAFVSIWTSSAKGIVEKLRQHSIYPTQLEEVKWSLNVQTSSDSDSKQAVPKAILQLGLRTEADPENITLQFSHQQLFEFYKQLETVQGQLDALR